MEKGNFIQLKFQNGYILKEFLYIPERFTDILIYNKSDYYWVYCIIDKRSDACKPIYIGKTTDLNVRARQYYNHSSTDLYYSPTKGFPQRILDHIHDEGIENFILMPIYADTNPDYTAAMEMGAIIRFDTIDHGFNSVIASVKYERPAKSGEVKRKQSKLCFILNPVTKVGYICSGFKLASEIIGGERNAKKGAIINAAKRACPRKDYFIYFLDYIRFEEAKNRTKDILNKHSWKGISHDPKEVYSLANDYGEIHEAFLKYSKFVKRYMKTGDSEDYKILFATQPEGYVAGYITVDPKEILRRYSEEPLKIYNGEPKFIFE